MMKTAARLLGNLKMASAGRRVKLLALLIAAPLLNFGDVVAQTAQTKPELSKTLEVYHGKPAELDISVPKNKEFRTRLRAALREPANFAGHYVLTFWGCGTRCLTGAAVDLRTGKVAFLDFTVCCWPDEAREGPFRFLATSAELGVLGRLNEEGPTDVSLFELKNGAFERKRLEMGDIIAAAVVGSMQNQSQASQAPEANQRTRADAELRSNATLASEDPLFSLSVCNKSNTKAYLILFRRHLRADDKWQLDGWHPIEPGACAARKIPRGFFYISANGENGRVWSGSDRYLCISKRPTERVVFENERCVIGETNRGFKELFNVNDAFSFDLT
jgi:uncharacterized membrane protein